MEILDRGRKIWELPNGKSRREDGPAVEFDSGTKEWYINGNLHREDGPAIEGNGFVGDGFEDNDDTYAFYYLNGEQLTKKQYKKRTIGTSRRIKLKELLYGK